MQLNAGNHQWDRLIQAMTLARSQPALPQATPTGMPDLIVQAATGCNHARATLLGQHQDIWYRFCLSLLRNPDTARDATQETALRVLRGLGSYRGESAFKTWSLSIAINVCREHRRRQRWTSTPLALLQISDDRGPHDRVEASERDAQLMDLLESLPRRQREAVTLRYLHQLSTRETATAMRCKEGTVKATLAKALTKLREHWGEYDA